MFVPSTQVPVVHLAPSQTISVMQPQPSNLGGIPVIHLPPQLPSTYSISQPSFQSSGVTGQNNFYPYNNYYYPGSSSFYAFPSNNSAKPTSSQSNPGMNSYYNAYPGSYPYGKAYPSNSNIKPTASQSISEIKRHLVLLETPTNDAKPKQAEINLLIAEIKPKVNSLESAIQRDDFDYFSSKLDYLLKQIELNTSRPSFDKISNFYLNSDVNTIYALYDLLERNVFSQKSDFRLEFMQNNSNRIIALLAGQLDCILSIKSNQYFSDINLVHNFQMKIISNIEAILNLINTVLNCLDHSALAEETLSKLMENLLPLKMIENKKKSNAALTLYYPINFPCLKSILASTLFWSASKWFVSPSALLATSLKLIRELTLEASVTNNSITNKYLFLSKIHNFGYKEKQSEDKSLALETFCQDLGSLIRQMWKVELEESRLDAILFDIYSLSQHDPGFKLLKSADADFAMFNLLDLIINQFGERIWDHFALVDREIEKQSTELGDSKKVWLLNYLKSLGCERKGQTSSKTSTLVPAWPDLHENGNENIIKQFQKLKDELNKKIVDIEKFKKTINFNE